MWIHALDQSVDSGSREAILAQVNEFIARWSSHGRAVAGAAAILDDQLLLTCGAIPGGAISGCGIDALTHAVESAVGGQGLRLASSLLVTYRDEGGRLRSAPRSDFRRLLASGVVGDNTHVFDFSVSTLGELRSGGLEKPFRASWHARVFRKHAAPVLG